MRFNMRRLIWTALGFSPDPQKDCSIVRNLRPSAFYGDFVLLWLPMQRIPPALAPMLFVPGLLYESLVRARNGLYAAGVLPGAICLARS